MPNITCPSCGEKGKIPPTMIGKRIKCAKCGNAFLVSPPAPKAPAATAPEAAPAAAVAAPAQKQGFGDEIQVDGLDESSWDATPVAPAEHDHAHDHDHDHDAEHSGHDAKFTAHEPGATKQYKIVSSRDKYFESTRYDLETIEVALNEYARQGWVVKGLSPAHVLVRGVEKEQVVFLLER